jgi:hypothetical protein
MSEVHEHATSPRVWRRNRTAAVDVVLLAALWVTGALHGFDTSLVVIAVVWTLRVILFDRRGYRLVTRGRSWWPSKNPDDYV